MPTFFGINQAIEVSRRQAKLRESNGNPESASKLEAAEAKLKDLKSNMTTLGKEASAAMTAVEAQQQRLTLQRLVAMVILVSFYYCNSVLFPFSIRDLHRKRLHSFLVQG